MSLIPLAYDVSEVACIWQVLEASHNWNRRDVELLITIIHRCHCMQNKWANLPKHLLPSTALHNNCVRQVCLRQPKCLFVRAATITTLWWDLCQCGLVVLVLNRWLTVLQVSREFLYYNMERGRVGIGYNWPCFPSSAIFEHLSLSVATTSRPFLLDSEISGDWC